MVRGTSAMAATPLPASRPLNWRNVRSAGEAGPIASERHMMARVVAQYLKSPGSIWANSASSSGSDGRAESAAAVGGGAAGLLVPDDTSRSGGGMAPAARRVDEAIGSARVRTGPAFEWCGVALFLGEVQSAELAEEKKTSGRLEEVAAGP